MAKRRKVGNMLGLAVLSTVVERPMHPYEIASVLRERDKEADMDIKWGTLYTVVRNLVKHGFLEVADTERAGARPERTVYRITGSGRAELADWVRELVAEPQPEHPKFKAGLSVLGVLSPDETTRLLTQRLEALEAADEALRSALSTYSAQVPRLFLIESEYELAVRDAEATWVRSLLAELESGTFPDLALWRALYVAQASSAAEVPSSPDGQKGEKRRSDR
jgi:DNA-binding PadR family transcriptional regulator